MEKQDGCPFELGEIVIFTSWLRFEQFISRIMQIHIDYWEYGSCGLKIEKAILYEKKQWYENGEHELVIGEIRNGIVVPCEP